MSNEAWNILGRRQWTTAGTGGNQVNDANHNQAATNQDVSGSDFSCPVCLRHVLDKDVASLPRCGHCYCVYCIVRWAEERDSALCPVCKKRYHTVQTLRNLDGTIRDSKVEESICLIKRTSWYLRKAKGKNELLSAADSGCYDEEWDDDFFCSNEIDDTEDYYFSNAAGSARIVLANRTFGKNGYIRNGRVYAQSTGQSIPKSKAETDGSVPAIVSSKTKQEGQKTNTKGKKTLRREKKRREASRLD